MVEIALGVIERRLGLRIFGKFLERQIGIAEQLIERGVALLLVNCACNSAVTSADAAVSTSTCEVACEAASFCLRSKSRFLELDILLRKLHQLGRAMRDWS